MLPGDLSLDITVEKVFYFKICKGSHGNQALVQGPWHQLLPILELNLPVKPQTIRADMLDQMSYEDLSPLGTPLGKPTLDN